MRRKAQSRAAAKPAIDWQRLIDNGSTFGDGYDSTMPINLSIWPVKLGRRSFTLSVIPNPATVITNATTVVPSTATVVPGAATVIPACAGIHARPPVYAKSHSHRDRAGDLQFRPKCRYNVGIPLQDASAYVGQ